MNVSSVRKSLNEIQARAKVNCLDMEDIYSLQKSAIIISKQLIKNGLDIEFYYCYGSKNGGWGSNSTSVKCDFNKDGTFKHVEIGRKNSKYSNHYIQIKGFSSFSKLERNLLKLHFNCNSYGEIKF